NQELLFLEATFCELSYSFPSHAGTDSLKVSPLAFPFIFLLQSPVDEACSRCRRAFPVIYPWYSYQKQCAQLSDCCGAGLNGCSPSSLRGSTGCQLEGLEQGLMGGRVTAAYGHCTPKGTF
uniref:Uncharacterized protein n=1 Tax=Athene cunicularia TaxID=194338 RepID=A0A663N2J5_ATHCN